MQAGYQIRLDPHTPAERVLCGEIISISIFYLYGAAASSTELQSTTLKAEEITCIFAGPSLHGLTLVQFCILFNIKTDCQGRLRKIVFILLKWETLLDTWGFSVSEDTLSEQPPPINSINTVQSLWGSRS